MNRFKKELRKAGWKLESDYPYLPYDGVETVVAKAETATLSVYHICAGWGHFQFKRNFDPEFKSSI